MTIYAVIFGNYFPREVESLWEVKEDADKEKQRLCELPTSGECGMWEVTEMWVHPSQKEV